MKPPFTTAIAPEVLATLGTRKEELAKPSPYRIPDTAWDVGSSPKVESDPSGKDSSQPGAKLDAGKIMPSLILSSMPRALMEVAKVGTAGAAKYSRNGWIAVPDGIERYTDAMDRHRLKEFIEGPLDLDFLEHGVEVYHAAQIAWNALARLELMLREKARQESNKITGHVFN